MLPKAHLTLHSRYLALGDWSHHCDYLGHEDLFCIVLPCILATSSQYFLFLLGSYHFCPLSPTLHEMFPSIFLKRSLVFPILLFSSGFFVRFFVFLHCSHKKALSPLLAFSGTLHSVGCIFPFRLAFSSVLFSAICKAVSNTHFAFLHPFFLGLVLVVTSGTVLCTSIHISSDTLYQI